MKLAIVLYNLGGPDSLRGVLPFLFNLFNDRAIIGVPQPLRALIAALIAVRRVPAAQAIYAKIGGRSPILEETEAQASALRQVLAGAFAPEIEWSLFVAMRYWRPHVRDVVKRVKAFEPDRVLLLPLYPQFSTTSTGSFMSAWKARAASAGLAAKTVMLCCYPLAPAFIAAHAALLRASLAKAGPDARIRVLFSAHGLPKRVVERGDPYAFQIEQTAAAIVAAVGGLADWRVCYQSRVGSLEWIGPSTDEEIRRAAADGKGLVVVPIAFVSEHSETLVELDMDDGRLAAELGVSPYIRVPALNSAPQFIQALCDLARAAARADGVVTSQEFRYCPARFGQCPHPGMPPE